MKTKDGRRAYGSPPVCECGNLATVKHTAALICERCYQIEKKVFTDKNYCGVRIEENDVQDKDGEVMQVHGWRSQTAKSFDSQFE